MKDNKLKFFLFGALFIIFFQLIESISDLCLSWIEVYKVKPLLRTLKGNKDILDLQSSQEEIATQCMGFDMGGVEECYDDDEWDYEDKKSNKVKIGF